MKEVVGDIREVFYPHTAMKLKVRKASIINKQESNKAKLKDYLSSAKGFGVSHMMLFTSTDKSIE